MIVPILILKHFHRLTSLETLFRFLELFKAVSKITIFMIPTITYTAKNYFQVNS